MKDIIKILFIIPDHAFASMQFIVETIKALVFNGYDVHILINIQHDPPLGFQHKNLSIKYFRTYKLKGFYRLSLLQEAITCHIKYHYNFIIGESQTGLIIAYFLQKILFAKIIYYNDEIWLGNERASIFGKASSLLLKCMEKISNKHVMLTVTQDTKRARLLALVNEISISSIIPLPNAMSGCAIKLLNQHYLHDKLNIPCGKKIVLWLGGCSSGGGAIELASMANLFPDGYVLVFHFRSNKMTQYMEKVCSLSDNKKVYISRELVPYDQLDGIIASASIGLGLYADKGVNSRCMYFSSGRINAFLRFGIPCIVSDYIGFRWISRSGAGICINNPK